MLLVYDCMTRKHAVEWSLKPEIRTTEFQAVIEGRKTKSWPVSGLKGREPLITINNKRMIILDIWRAYPKIHSPRRLQIWHVHIFGRRKFKYNKQQTQAHARAHIHTPWHTQAPPDRGPEDKKFSKRERFFKEDLKELLDLNRRYLNFCIRGAMLQVCVCVGGGVGGWSPHTGTIKPGTACVSECKYACSRAASSAVSRFCVGSRLQLVAYFTAFREYLKKKKSETELIADALKKIKNTQKVKQKAF